MLASGLAVPYHRSMALTQFEKDCIAEMVAPLTGRRAPHRLTPEQQDTLETATQGDEAERRTMVTDYINDEGLDVVASEIASCDNQTAAIVTRKAELEAKQTAMEDYVA